MKDQQSDPHITYGPDVWRQFYPTHPGDKATDAELSAWRSAWMAVEHAENCAMRAQDKQAEPIPAEGDVICSACTNGLIAENVGGWMRSFDCPHCAGTGWRK